MKIEFKDPEAPDDEENLFEVDELNDVSCMVCCKLETECKCREDNNEYPYGEVEE